MRALIDTNILIHRETKNPVMPQIGTLFFWLQKSNYSICLHPITKEEILTNKDDKAVKSFEIKMSSYEFLRTPANLNPDVQKVSLKYDMNNSDKNDTKLLDEVYCKRVDIFITEDKKTHEKAKALGIQDKVFKIQGFLDKIKESTPGLVGYDVLAIQKKYFSEIDINDVFFDSLKNDYVGFQTWFEKKYGEEAYVLVGSNTNIEAFLYLKIEDSQENYYEISPVFLPKKRLKIGTLKVSKIGMKLGERFLKIIFDNAKDNNVEEIYVTIFKNSQDKLRLIELLVEWGFVYHGLKSRKEEVYVRKFTKMANTPVNRAEPKKTYPFISQSANFYMIPILPKFHTDLFPDSILRGEKPEEFDDMAPHRNAISKCYITSSPLKNLKSGDAIVFYRTGGHYKGVATTIGLVENVIVNIPSEDALIELTSKKTVFDEKELREYYKSRQSWSASYRPFIINFLYVGTLKPRPNLDKLIKLNIIDKAPRGVVMIKKESFQLLIKDNL